jgi:hypothetical protein
MENPPAGRAGKTGKPAWPAGRYLKYAIGEIVLVVIGILIALQLNAWKEEIQAKEELKASMDSMLDDLAQDIEFYSAEIERIGKRVILLNDFTQGNYSDIDIEDIPDILSYNIPNKDFGTTYLSLKQDRQFNMIKNLELKEKITSYYEVYCEEYSVIATWHREFVTETIENYFLLNLPYKRGYKVDSKDVINEVENGKLLSITNYQITVQDEAIVRLKNIKLLAEEMMQFINSEYK